MPRPEKCPSNNPKDIELFIKGWDEGQTELRTAVQDWFLANFDTGDEYNQRTYQSLLSAMEHS